MSDHAAPATPAIPPTGSKLFARLKVVGILSAIVIAQCLMAYFFFPSGAEVTASEATAAAAHEHDEHDGHDELHAEQREVDLGQFSLSALNPTTNTTLLIDFHLYGTTAEEPPSEHGEGGEADHGHGHGDSHKKEKAGAEPEDHSEFGKLLQKHKHRFRDQVIVIIRNAEAADLTDPGLGLIKRQILAKTNALFGKPLLKEVIFSDFAVVEQ